MMSPLRWVTGGGDQEKFTCLCPATASNISGAPLGTERQKDEKLRTKLMLVRICTSFKSSKVQCLWLRGPLINDGTNATVIGHSRVESCHIS